MRVITMLVWVRGQASQIRTGTARQSSVGSRKEMSLTNGFSTGCLLLLKTEPAYVELLNMVGKRWRRELWTEIQHLTTIFGEPAVSQALC